MSVGAHTSTASGLSVHSHCSMHTAPCTLLHVICDSVCASYGRRLRSLPLASTEGSSAWICQTVGMTTHGCADHQTALTATDCSAPALRDALRRHRCGEVLALRRLCLAH